ncbi:MAG: serine hydrolase domain-containing protein, partial [Deinococcota bacterium]
MDTAILDAFVVDKMSATGLPGLSLALVQDDQVVYARGFGLRDVVNGYPATPDTLYSIGSVTKSFTVLAILILVEEGKLQLDDPVDRYVPFSVKPMGENI